MKNLLTTKIKNFFLVNTFFCLILFFFLSSIVFTYPAILHLSDKLIGDGGDNYQNLIFQFIASGKIKHLQYPFSHTDILRFPVGFSFETGFESVVTILTGAFLSLFLNSILTYNITVFLLLTLNGFLSFLLFKYISKSNFLGIIGGIIYGYSSFVIGRSAGHLNLLFIGGFPLFIYALLKSKKNLTLRNITLVFIAGTLILLGSFQYALLFTLSFLICLPLLMFFFPIALQAIALNISKKAYKVLLLLLPFFVIIMIFSYPHLHAFLTGEFFKPDRTGSITILENSPSLKDFVLPNSYLPLQITELSKNLNNSFRSIDRVVFIGWVELFLFSLFIAFYKNKRLKYLILSVTLIFFIFSLGFINPESKIYLPYFFLHNIFPFSFIDEPTRFFVVFYLFLIIGVILQLKQMYKKNGKTMVFLIFVAILIVLERLPFNYWLAPTFVNDSFIQVVRKEKGTAVWDIPVSYTNSIYDVLPYAYDKKIISGPFQWFADTEKPKSFIKNNNLARFICGENIKINKGTESENIKLIQVLKTHNIQTIVVHTNDPKDHAKYYFPDCANARIQASILLPQLFMPIPTSQPKVLSLFFPTIPGVGDKIFFPYEGTFYINGFHAYPSSWLPIHLFLDGKEIALDQHWTDRGQKNATLDPFLKIDTKSGSKLRIEFDKNQNESYSFIKLWYRYEPNTAAVGDITINGITKVYQDDDATVFKIN